MWFLLFSIMIKFIFAALAAAYPVTNFTTIVIEPTAEHTHTVIFLHGFSGTAK